MSDQNAPENLARYFRRISRRKRKNRTVLFFGRREAFSDNSKYLFLDACRGDYGFTPLWITTSGEIAETLPRHGLPTLNIASDRRSALRHLLAAAAAVFCVNPNEALPETDFRAALDGAWKLQLWHGVFAGKQDLQVTGIAPELSLPLLRQIEGACSVDATLSPAESYDDRFMEAFGAPMLIRDGYPRNEVLERTPDAGDLIAAFPPLAPRAGQQGPAILYCPSHTRVGRPVWLQPELVNLLSELHEQLDATFHVKPHPFEAAIAQQVRQLAPGVTLIPALADIYPALPSFDMMISDYSSIMDDFALTGHPVITLELPATEKVRKGLLLEDLHYRSLARTATPATLESVVREASATGPRRAGSIYTMPHIGSAARINRHIAQQVDRIVSSRAEIIDLAQLSQP
jgi:hypothetical protein